MNTNTNNMFLLFAIQDTYEGMPPSMTFVNKFHTFTQCMEEVHDKYMDYDYVNIYNVTENKWYELYSYEYSVDEEVKVKEILAEVKVKEILAELNE